MILSPRQEKLVALRDEMSPGQRPGPIVPRTFGEAQAMCAALARSGLVPNMYIDKPENMIVTIMAGAELGLPPMASIRLYHIMDSIPRLSAEGIRAVLVSHPEIEYFEPHSCDDKHATWIGKRRGRPEKSATWTVEQAKRAGLWDRKNRDGSPGNWQKYTEDMLNARASMRLGRMIAPDIMAGMVSREEASDGDFIDVQATETRSAPVFVAPEPRLAADPRTVSVQMPGTFVPTGQTSGSGVTPGVLRVDQPQSTPTVVNIAPQGPPPGVPQPPPEKPRRERGAAAVRPTNAQPPSAGSTVPAASSVTSPPSSAASTAAASPPSEPAVIETPGKHAGTWVTEAANPTPPTSSTSPSPSVESAQTSSPASGAAAPELQSAPADDFGGEDPVDTPAAPDPVEAKLAEFHAWLKSCATQRDLVGGLAAWRAWSKDMSDTHGDLRFRKGGEITILMQDAYSKRKGEVPA